MSAPQMEFGVEAQGTGSWSWPVRMYTRGRVHDRVVRLTFADYDLWSRGRVAPAMVAEACLRWLLELENPKSWPDPFDCARARRRHPEVDAQLPTVLGKPLSG